MGDRVLPEGVHKAFMISNTLIYLLCKPLLRALAVPYEWAVPEHTQYALFQLYCDLRANPIKDRHWFEVHARRLKPHTFPGWIALGSALLYIASGLAISSSVALSLLAGTIYALIFLLASAGILAAVVTGLLAFSLFATACIASCAATGAAVAYGSVATAQAMLGWLSATLLPKPKSPFPDLPASPHLKPVATPRAPLPPDPAPAVQPASPLLGLSSSPPPPAPLSVSLHSSDLAPPPAAPLPLPVLSGPVPIAEVYTPDALDPIVEDAQLEAALAEQVADARAVLGAAAGEALGEEDEVSSSSTAAVAGLSAPPNDGPKAPAASQAGMTMATVASPQQQAAAGIVNGSANGHNGKTAAGKQHHGKQGHANGKAAHKRSGA